MPLLFAAGYALSTGGTGEKLRQWFGIGEMTVPPNGDDGPEAPGEPGDENPGDKPVEDVYKRQVQSFVYSGFGAGKDVYKRQAVARMVLALLLPPVSMATAMATPSGLSLIHIYRNQESR